MPYSEAQKKATLKYRKEKYSRISLDLKKEKKDEYKAQAAARGLSLNAYIISLLEADRASLPDDNPGHVAQAVLSETVPESAEPQD